MLLQFIQNTQAATFQGITAVFYAHFINIFIKIKTKEASMNESQLKSA